MAINKKLQELRDRGAGKVSFNWDIHWYVTIGVLTAVLRQVGEIRRRNINIPLEKLTNFWAKIYEKYGSVKIAITGGEPFLYPNFIELINAISRQHSVEVVTNLSWSVKI